MVYMAPYVLKNKIKIKITNDAWVGYLWNGQY
jgi:hypothetical protein